MDWVIFVYNAIFVSHFVFSTSYKPGSLVQQIYKMDKFKYGQLDMRINFLCSDVLKPKEAKCQSAYK